MIVARQVSAFLFVLGVVQKFEIIIFLIEVTGARVKESDRYGGLFSCCANGAG